MRSRALKPLSRPLLHNMTDGVQAQNNPLRQAFIERLHNEVEAGTHEGKTILEISLESRIRDAVAHTGFWREHYPEQAGQHESDILFLQGLLRVCRGEKVSPNSVPIPNQYLLAGELRSLSWSVQESHGDAVAARDSGDSEQYQRDMAAKKVAMRMREFVQSVAQRCGPEFTSWKRSFSRRSTARDRIEATPETDRLLIETAGNPTNHRGQDQWGNDWFTQSQSDGSEIWVKVRNGKILYGGINDTPARWFGPLGLQ